MPRVHVGEYGFRLILATGYDFTDYTSLKIRFEKPDGEKVSKGASTTDPTSGDLYYTVEDGFIDEAGQYEAQAIIEFAGKKLIGERVTIPVLTPI